MYSLADWQYYAKNDLVVPVAAIQKRAIHPVSMWLYVGRRCDQDLARRSARKKMADY